jgi:hypothetical protein
MHKLSNHHNHVTNFKSKHNINKYLESLHTLFKWNIGITRVAFSNPATATASHICTASSIISARIMWTPYHWCSSNSIKHVSCMPGSLPSYFIQTKMTQRTNTRKKIFTNFIRQALDITQWHPFSETNYRCGKSL